MKVAFVFPGQGAEYVGMGKDLYEKYKEAREVYDKVQDIIKIDVKNISFEGSIEDLTQTKNTQISILTMSLAILKILEKNKIKSDILAGLSLGEYSALIYSNVFSFEDGVKIVQKRGEIMQKYTPKGKWKMSAIIGLTDEKVEEICKKVKTGFVVPANYNCPNQVVISGEEQAVEKAMEIAKLEGAKKTIELQTRGPFHTSKLEEASKQFRHELDKVDINTNFSNIIIKNIDAVEYRQDDNIREILAKHIMSPVKFKDSIEKMLNLGVDTFVEIGPGKVLSGFIKRINKEVNIMNITDCESLENVLDYFAQKGGN